MSLQGHRFEVHIYWSQKSHDNIGMVMGIKNVYVMEGVINNRDLCLHFLNRSIPSSEA